MPNPEPHIHCPHFTGRAVGIKEIVFCCFCNTHGMQTYDTRYKQVEDHGPFLREEVRVALPIIWD